MGLHSFISHSIKTRITFFSLVIFVASIWALGFYASHRLQVELQQELGQQQIAAVTSVAAGINHELQERMEVLVLVAQRMGSKELQNDAVLRDTLGSLPVFNTLFNAGAMIVDVNGTVRVTIPQTQGPMGNGLSVDAIAQAINRGQASVGQPVMEPSLHVPMLTLAVPIRNARGDVIGALAGLNNLNLPNMLDAISEARYGRTGSYLLVSRPHRLVITTSGKKRFMDAAPAPGINSLIDRFMNGEEVSAVFYDPFKVEILTAAKSVPLANWYVAAALPTAEAFAPIVTMQQRIMLATLVLTLLAGSLTWWMLRRQLSPLLYTAKTLADLTQEPSFRTVLPIVHDDEIGQVVAGFNQLLAKLQQRETLLQQIFDTSSAAIFVIDPEGRIAQSNRRMTEMFGWPSGELIGCDYVSLVHPSQRAEGRDNMLNLLSNIVASSDLDRLYCRADGSEFWGHLTCRGFHDVACNEHRFVGVITDITERVQSEQFERLRGRILEKLSMDAPLPMILDALASGVEELNPGARCGILRVTNDGQHLGQCVGPNLPDFFRFAMEGIEISNQAWPCAQAVCNRQLVVQADLAGATRDPALKDCAERAGMMACLAQPVFSATGQVFAVVTLYFNAVHHPTAAEITSVERFARVISVVIERHTATQKIRDSEARFRILIEESPAAISVHRNSRMLYLNPAAVSLLGASSTQQVIGKSMLDLIHPSSHELALSRARAIAISGEQAPLVDEIFLRFDGTPINVEVQSTAILYEGEPAIRTAFRDITERKRAREKLQLAANVFTYARECILIADAHANVVDVNAAFCRISGYEREEVLGRNADIFRSARIGKKWFVTMRLELKKHGHWSGEVWSQRKNGESFPVMLTVSAVRSEQGDIQNYVALFSDISAIKEHQRELEHIAHFDALTNLPNRVLLGDRLQQGMVQAQRRGQILGLAYLDLDGFKSINDRHGHEAGDLLLRTVSARMKQALREGDTLARMGGDEFVAVLLDLHDTQGCLPMLKRLLLAAAEAVNLGDITINVSASLGVTFYPQSDPVEADQLIRQADQAMYHAKQTGKNRYHFFDTEQDRTVRGHHESVERIAQALGQREFVLYYQPKVNMRSGAVVGVEALIRWQHPDKGLLAPALFLPVIEDHPLSVDIGEWVIDTALTQQALWQAQGIDTPISVNVGARQLQQADFVVRLTELLNNHPEVKPFRLEIEVLETSAIQDWVGVSEVIETCREIGVLFAMDDFGTGYSSLTYLKRLQVNLLKIDQSFVRDMLEDTDDLAILRGVIGLANAFRREVIAEGVETVAHGAALLRLGCDLAQGYGIARPMPADQFPAWAATWKPDPAWQGI